MNKFDDLLLVLVIVIEQMNWGILSENDQVVISNCKSRFHVKIIIFCLDVYLDSL